MGPPPTLKPPRRKPRRAKSLREHGTILNAATQIATKLGLHAITGKLLQERTGIPPSRVWDLFGGINNLKHAVFEYHWDNLARLCDEVFVIASELPPDAADAAICRHLLFGTPSEHPESFHRMMLQLTADSYAKTIEPLGVWTQSLAENFSNSLSNCPVSSYNAAAAIIAILIASAHLGEEGFAKAESDIKTLLKFFRNST